MKKALRVLLAVAILVAAAAATPHVTYACDNVFPGQALC
jgi:hypothetical protein